jgi:hypothetical protein
MTNGQVWRLFEVHSLERLSDGEVCWAELKIPTYGSSHLPVATSPRCPLRCRQFTGGWTGQALTCLVSLAWL